MSFNKISMLSNLSVSLKRALTTTAPKMPMSGNHKLQIMEALNKSLTSSVVALYRTDIHHMGTGVFLDPTLIVTSAHVVGHVTTEKACIGTTAALTANNTQVLNTKVLAVNFSNDLAVLKVVKPEGTLFPHRQLAKSPPEKGDMLMAISNRHDTGCVSACGHAIGGEKMAGRAKAPWPLDDGVTWMAHSLMVYPGDTHPPFGTGAVTWAMGSPWFNLDGEVVGIASWEEASEDKPDDESSAARFLVGYAVPPVSIEAVLEYAKNKGPQDPVVMDPWIGSAQV